MLFILVQLIYVLFIPIAVFPGNGLCELFITAPHLHILQYCIYI